MATLDKDMTRAEFEALIDKTFDTMKATGLPQTREQLAKDMLSRLAQKNGISVEDAEAALDAASAPKEEEPASPPKRKKDLAEATKSLRAITSKGPYFYENPADPAQPLGWHQRQPADHWPVRVR